MRGGRGGWGWGGRRGYEIREERREEGREEERGVSRDPSKERHFFPSLNVFDYLLSLLSVARTQRRAIRTLKKKRERE